jgi:hypothetical protein
VIAFQLLQYIRASRWVRAGDLLAFLQKDRSTTTRATMMRIIKSLGDQLVIGGAGSKTTYAARRAIRGNIEPIALYEIDENGHGSQVATIEAIYPSGCLLRLSAPLAWPLTEDMRDGWYYGMPYFLDDMRPQGFLGRNFAHAYADMYHVDVDPSKWKEDDVLALLSALGADSQGNWIIGEPAYRRYLARMQEGDEVVLENDVEASYAKMAASAMEYGIASSSAGGEFPKFTTCRDKNAQPVHVIVKFSGNDATPGVQRWSDLLICEHHALSVIHDRFPFKAAQSTVYQGAGRTYLEVDRFDRHGKFGRSPVCTWAAMEPAMFAAGGSWVEGAKRLRTRGFITDETLQHISILFMFGKLITNSDMHDGNLAFRPAPKRGMFELAPVFDMLPMLYAPVRGVELPKREFKVALPLPNEMANWRIAAQAALNFWQAVSNDERVTEEFRQTSAQNAKSIQSSMALLPRS